MLNYSVAELRNNNHYEDEFNLTCLFPSYLIDMSGTKRMTIMIVRVNKRLILFNLESIKV